MLESYALTAGISAKTMFKFPPRSCRLTRPTVVQFFGGGQDSVALLYKLYYDAEFRAKYVGDSHFVAIMSDTGDEHDDLYENMPLYKAWCEQVGIEFYFITNDMGYHSEAWMSLLGQFYRNDNIMGVAFPKSCTDQLKIKVCYNFLADWLRWSYGFTSVGYKTYYEYEAYYGKLISWIGFAAGEEKRQAEGSIAEGVTMAHSEEITPSNPITDSVATKKASKKPRKSRPIVPTDLYGVPIKTKKRSDIPIYRQRCVTHVYPLIELGLNRAACQQLIRGYGHRVPFPTSCKRCPFMGEVELVYLYRTNQRDYNEWVEREAAKLKKNEDKPINLGVMGQLTLSQYLAKAIEKYGHWSIEELTEYSFSHGHCVMSRI